MERNDYIVEGDHACTYETPVIWSINFQKGTTVMIVDDLARFTNNACYDLHLDAAMYAPLKSDYSIPSGTAIGAIEGPPVKAIRTMIEEFAGSAISTLIGGGKATPTAAALYNSGLIRYLGLNDSYLAKGETCHPSR
ncbi:MmgE/PrpD family protein [Rhodohalobacter sp.]|uniref:MmgE/PrpD family protein n=1 Tax=Rhodohalobacter sp. TaxID=1974210 RepID=UPI002ACE7F1F|nr:MmgE/PrpD family protein [Rhodohalobacter sp.]MDZ7757285.1 MmgE/PrpD family protein [Rhodohalobacter sp.]